MPKKGLHLFFRTEGSESDSSSGDDDDEEEEEAGDEGGGGGEEGGGGGEVEWTPSGPQRALGDWEKYTTVSGSCSASIQLLILYVCSHSGYRLQADGQDGIYCWVSIK